MPFTPSVASLVSSRVIPPPVRPHPFRFRGHALRLGCLSAAGCLCLAKIGGLRGAQSRKSKQVTKSKSSTDFGDPSRRVTDSLLVTNLILFAVSLLTKKNLDVWGVKHNPSINRGELWRLITPAFLHGNIVHLVLNCAALNNLGPLVEAVSGRPRFLSVYFTAAVTGVAASYVGTPAVSMGSSGAIFGLGGALAMFVYRHKDFFGTNADSILGSLGQSLAINVFYGLVAANVDNWAHMGGLLGGAFAAYLLGPRLVQVTLEGSKQPVMADQPPIGVFAAKSRHLRA